MSPMADIPEDIRKYLSEIGRKGGKTKTPKGFARMDPAKRAAAGRKGGIVPRKKKTLDS